MTTTHGIPEDITTQHVHLVSSTHETEPIAGWVYRIIQDGDGVHVHRVPEDKQLWGHGIYKQVYQTELMRFVQACYADGPYLMDMDAALDVIFRQEVKPAKRCEPCRETGAIHCSDPEHCGGPWDKMHDEVSVTP